MQVECFSPTKHAQSAQRFLTAGGSEVVLVMPLLFSHIHYHVRLLAPDPGRQVNVSSYVDGPFLGLSRSSRFGVPATRQPVINA